MDEEIATYLGPKGYSIKKEHITIQEQELIRKELTVKAFVPKVLYLNLRHFLYIVNLLINFMSRVFTAWIHMANQMQ